MVRTLCEFDLMVMCCCLLVDEAECWLEGQKLQ
jgi:hypothetical protein